MLQEMLTPESTLLGRKGKGSSDQFNYQLIKERGTMVKKKRERTQLEKWKRGDGESKSQTLLQGTLVSKVGREENTSDFHSLR